MDERMIRTASGWKPMPSVADLAARSRANMCAVLAEAGCDPDKIDQEADRLLGMPLLFDLPSDADLNERSADRGASGTTPAGEERP